WTPGCTAAVAAGAHVGALRAGATPATPANTTRAEARRAAAGRTRRVRMGTTYSEGPDCIPAGELLLTGLSGHVQQDPSRPHGDHQGRAAEGDERQRHAGDGEHPDHRPDVDEGLANDPRRDAGGEESAEAIGGLEGSAHAEDCEGSEQADHEEGADEAQLLTDDGEDEVGVGVG